MVASIPEIGYWLCVFAVILVVTGLWFPAARARDAPVCRRSAAAVVFLCALGGLVRHGAAPAALVVAGANLVIVLALAGLATWHLWRSPRPPPPE